MTEALTAGTVTIDPFGVDISVNPEERLLDAILRAGRYVPFGCNHGGCGTCAVPVVSGRVEQDPATLTTLDSRSRDEGQVLLCSSYLRSAVATVDISETGITETEFAGTDQVDTIVAVAEVRVLTPDLTLLRLQPPVNWNPVAGQFIQVEVPNHTGWRSYSVASTGAAAALDLLIRRVPDGAFSDALPSLAPGDPLRIRGPYGTFTVRTSHRRKVFVGGGAGIGPIRPMIVETLLGRDRLPVDLVHTGRTLADLAFHDEFIRLADEFDEFTYHPVVTADLVRSVRGGRAAIDAIDALGIGAELRRTEAYVCGPDSFVDVVSAHLLDSGLRERYLAADRFTASGGPVDPSR
ncbi:2Fe-2S iron-sulfur cluster-binding protein [Gordonia sp. GONU]|uniref:2Fe-2S iron-sulfur cluster-binding protein n=1 Tax=Gordonia sp. GONU TaxID=2972949 RepID=UPI0021ACF4B6|nr:2Fe-2S iron-sulfur cluster-binding protein [Gordonia sp. GONU]MCR8896829.1 2Fe-2S iron-sulfur cluster-binding protein [Gordonia sp. GONU]